MEKKMKIVIEKPEKGSESDAKRREYLAEMKTFVEMFIEERNKFIIYRQEVYNSVVEAAWEDHIKEWHAVLDADLITREYLKRNAGGGVCFHCGEIVFGITRESPLKAVEAVLGLEEGFKTYMLTMTVPKEVSDVETEKTGGDR